MFLLMQESVRDLTPTPTPAPHSIHCSPTTALGSSSRVKTHSCGTISSLISHNTKHCCMFKSAEHWDDVFRGLSRKYGQVFTVWFANTPLVVITDIDIAREAFHKRNLTGRPSSYFAKQLSNDNHREVVFSDGHEWEAIRRTTQPAIQFSIVNTNRSKRKYSTLDKLIYLTVDCVDQTVKSMIDREGLDKPFIVKDYIFYMFFNIISASILGKSYTMDDPELKRFKYVLMDVGHEVGARFMLWDFSSFIRLLDRRSVQKQQQILTEMSLMIRNKFKDHYADYSDAIERDICDALITAKNEALREGKEWAPYLTDDNLAMSAMSLFLGGISTSQNTFQWIVLLMCYYPEVQRKLRQEIETQIGDRMPTHEDRNRCHYVMAFIAETLRFRNIIPIGVPHRALVDIQIVALKPINVNQSVFWYT
ncbi:unnamed protein product [Oppiella nova]|uniref:Cytochrome P450 n=1 Tax=Oppiella nova TaxID=334625 RepID=A0A7R9QSD5_9ACAR|nr:unnamed protein product [Oppiella nova]CAG2172630.1 unnamed protein product [Oppiella nova]